MTVLSEIRIIVFVVIFFNQPVVTTCQESTCDVVVPCSCCADGGVSCAYNPDDYCEDNCKDGYYGAKCIIPCPAECVSCHQHFGQTNECFRCINGRYGNACTNVCSECLSCNKDTGACIDCASGFYGETCANNCSQTCEDGQCNIVSGRCEDCSIGYYGDMCNDKCSETCHNTTCDRTSGICHQCFNGYYGDNCDMKCSENCLDTCHMTTGICTQCIDGTYGEYCDLYCTPSCKGSLCDQISGTCTNGCVENFHGDNCDNCITGKYGARCDKNCPPNCLHNACKRNSGTCDSGCKPGYSDSLLCCADTTNCNLCSSPYECTRCTTGKYGQKCEHSCPDNCEGQCAKSSGTCENCKLNYYGSRCDNKCSETCFTGVDNTSRCNHNNATCKFGCVNGFYGDSCELSCSEYCNDTCQQNSGECHSCKYNRYGKVCEHTCFHACVRTDSETVCNKSNGNCLQGCLHGFHDSRCDKTCSEGCKNKSCNIYTGYCTNGCANGFSGQFCLEDRHADIQTDSNDSSSVAVGISLGVVSVLLIAGIAVAVVFRKGIIRKLKRRDLPQSSSNYDDLNTDLRATGAAYTDVSYDNTNNDRITQVYINTIIQQNSDATEPGPYVNIM